ncbi:MAG: phosphoenolpyruvate synthase, partial [Planctomycetota bacterium]
MNAEYHQPADLNRWFDQLGLGDLPSVGGKNASLGEMIRELSPKGVRVPNGFATTADAYWLFLTESGLDGKIREILSGVDVGDVGNLQHHAMMIRHMILDAPLPHSLTDSIVDAYHHLCDAGDHGLADVAVRSSATAENFPEAGLAGQQETYLNVRGQASLLDACRRCYASLFTDRAISYRARHGFDDMQVALSIGVQSMVRSDLATAGVMFSIDPESGFRDAVLINAAYGLGENVVQGNVSPDEYYVFKPTLRSGCRPIIRKSVGAKSMKMVYDSGGNKLTRNEPVPPAQASRYALSDDEILQLARWACEIEDHYSQRSDRACPMDMEWAKDGRSGELFIVQARPETVQSQKTGDTLQRYRLKDRGRVMLTGRSVGEKIASGPVRVIRDVGELERFQDGEVLVADRTDPDWEPVMKRAAGVVTNRGGRTCHAAAVSREIGLPAVVATGDATEKLSDGQLVTICCVEGAKGLVYEGERGFEIDEFNVGELRRPQ